MIRNLVEDDGAGVGADLEEAEEAEEEGGGRGREGEDNNKGVLHGKGR